MRRSTSLLVALVMAAGAAGAFAQAAQQGQSSGSQAAPAASKVVPEDLPPGQATPATGGGIQGQNIFDVKPEVKKDANNEPGYLEQSNGQRNRVQPGNNAP